MLYTKSSCLNPVLTPVYRPDDSFGKPVYLELDCGHCIYCKLKKAREKTMRMQMELQSHRESCFVTLTYENKNLPFRVFENSDIDGYYEPQFSSVPTLNPKDLQLFLKRLRKALSDYHISIRFFACGEYGPKYGRPHYHIVIYGIGQEFRNLINRCWGKGFVTVRPVFPETLKYVAGYVVKKLYSSERCYAPDNLIFREPEFTRCSQHLGLDYFIEKELPRIDVNHFYINWKGFKYAIPRTFVRYCTNNGFLPKKSLDWYKWQQNIQTYDFYKYLDDIGSTFDDFQKQRFQNAKHLEEKCTSSRLKYERGF